MKFKAVLYYNNTKIAEGVFEEEPFASGLPGPKGLTNTKFGAFSIEWGEIEQVKE